MLPPDVSAAAAVASPPVLLLIFNRPDTTRRVLTALRQVRPARLYVAADGPRAGHPTDAAQCAATRQLVHELVDWPCELQTLFRDTNLNCGLGPATAIDWFFGQEEAGIILEDDCVPTPGFFGFCAELLARYRHDTRVMHIGGNNFSAAGQRRPAPTDDSYSFSSQVYSWGWATWRRAWQLYDFNLSSFRALEQRGALANLYSSALENRYQLNKIRGVLDLPQPPDVWDYQWHFAVVANSGLSIIPATNLVSNIGFGEHGTHTHDDSDHLAALPTVELPFPLRHPDFVLRDQQRDRRRFREFMLSRLRLRGQQLLARLVPLSSSSASSPTEAAVPLPQPLHL